MKYSKRSGRARRYGASLVVGVTLALSSNLPAHAAIGTVHLVRAGDSLGSIARKYNVPVSSVAAANGITNLNRVRIGTRLAIPSVANSAPAARAVTTGVHIVMAGENLGSIARKYAMTTKALAGANGIVDINHVRIGTRLNVAGAAPALVSPAPLAPPAAPAPPAARAPAALPTLPSQSSVKPSARGKLPSRLRTSPERMALMPVFDKWASADSIAPDLLKATCWMESGWRNDAVSSTGALGIGQLLPSTARYVSSTLIGQPSLDSRRPEDNIRMSARYLRYLINLNAGDERMALASYYQGYGSVQRIGVQADTVRYVDTIMALRPAFQ